MSDLIKREDAIETAYQLRHKPNDEEWAEWLKAFNAIPSADRPQGEWIEHWYPHFDVAGIECSICSKDVPYWERNYDMPRYCPNCGAKMFAKDTNVPNKKGANDE